MCVSVKQRENVISFIIYHAGTRTHTHTPMHAHGSVCGKKCVSEKGSNNTQNKNSSSNKWCSSISLQMANCDHGDDGRIFKR